MLKVFKGISSVISVSSLIVVFLYLCGILKIEIYYILAFAVLCLSNTIYIVTTVFLEEKGKIDGAFDIINDILLIIPCFFISSPNSKMICMFALFVIAVVLIIKKIIIRKTNDDKSASQLGDSDQSKEQDK